MAANYPREQRIANVRRAWELACAGRTHEAIGRELGISQSQVTRYLQAARKRAWADVDEAVATYFVLSIRQSDMLLSESLDGLERSKRPRKKATRKASTAGTTTGDAPGDAQTISEVVERDGDPEWIASARETIRLRAELLARFSPPPADRAKPPGAGTVADALLEAELADDAYRRDDAAPDPGIAPDATDPGPPPRV